MAMPSGAAQLGARALAERQRQARRRLRAKVVIMIGRKTQQAGFVDRFLRALAVDAFGLERESRSS